MIEANTYTAEELIERIGCKRGVFNRYVAESGVARWLSDPSPRRRYTDEDIAFLRGVLRLNDAGWFRPATAGAMLLLVTDGPAFVQELSARLDAGIEAARTPTRRTRRSTAPVAA